ncbi:alpha/beta fold hydrolase [Rhodoferax sp.]|uniref:alpha/beta fold hydrolase n=1 Tax=Rhodoferax sp. TaxID=50421 RepID=UPI0027157269|nr:alpha/beta hydrolase [Rhodoferax sp.]MDO9197732.1 alpha/beta hydrolase [Rhodoferax sp.]
MTTPALNIDGIDVFIEGDGPHTIVMIHGWPDTHRLWDGTVAALQSQYRCVRFTLPGFDVAQPARATSLAQMTALFSQIVEAISPGQPVTLLLHDWGCMFGYEYAMRHPARVARIVAVDIGDHNARAFLKSLTASAKWQVFAYQFWLALAWKLGGTISRALGNRMTRSMARALRCRTEPARIGWQMNYPYAMQWFGLLGGFRGAAQVDPACPLLYLYGERKPFMFHSPEWLAQVARRPGCAVQAFHTGHWVMVDQPSAFNQCVQAWLARTKMTTT